MDEQTRSYHGGRRYSDGLHQAIEAKENVKVEAATQTFATSPCKIISGCNKLAGMTGTAETEAGNSGTFINWMWWLFPPTNL